MAEIRNSGLSGVLYSRKAPVRPYQNVRPTVSLCGILLSLIALLPSPLAGQIAVPGNLRFGHLGVEQGLSHTTVWDVLQDRSGFLWIATESSLQRYDGYELVDFRHDPQDLRSLSNSEVMKIHEDRSGVLYFATRGSGINRYDPATGLFERFRLEGDRSLEVSDEPSPMVWAMNAETAENGGALWVATLGSGLRRIELDTRRLTRFRHLPDDPGSLGHDWVSALYRAKDGQLYVGHGAGIDRFVPASGTFEHLPLAGLSPEGALTAIGERPGGGLWAVWGAGTEAPPEQSHIYFWEDGRFVLAATVPIGVSQAVAAADGSFWLGTVGAGLYRFDPVTERLAAARWQPSDRESLSSDIVLSLRFDRAGLLWIGTRNGLSIYDPRLAQFEVARQGRGLWSNSVGVIQVDRQGAAWLGSVEGDLIWWHPGEGVFRKVASGLGAVNGLLETRAGEIWVGSALGLFRVRCVAGQPDPSSCRLEKTRSSGVKDPIYALFEDATGHLWVGHSTGLARLDARGVAAPPPAATLASAEWPRLVVYAISGDRGGRLWIGGNNGLRRLDPATFTMEAWHHRAVDGASLPNEQVTDVVEDGQGRILVGTYGGGLGLFDRAANTFTRFGSHEGLADDRVCSLVEDAGGAIWVSTNRGLSRFDPAARKVRNYDSADGLASDVFMIQARGKLPDGRVVFGGHQGLTSFYPERLHGDALPPPVLLTELRVGGEVMRPGAPGSPLQYAISSSRRFVLDFRQTSFALQFAAPHFANPKKNRYAYRLVGYEEAWTETGAGDRRARYTNLDPGSYVFEVKASNEDGVWNEEGARIEILVLPAPWRTPWAYALYAASFLGAIFAYNRWQGRRLARERQVADELARLNAELERLVEERTSEVKQLTGLLPICSGCKKIRDQEGRWQTLETYLNSVGDLKLSHGICRDCAKHYYPELDIDQLAG